MLLDIFLTILLVFLNGFFVAAEFAIVKVRISQIELRLLTGGNVAKTARHILTHLDAYLSATQLGITLASLGLGWIGESVVSSIVIDIFHVVGYRPDPDLAHKIALPFAFGIITFLHIVFGELAPKSMAIQKPEAVTLGIALPLQFFYIIFKPFIWMLNGVANYILRAVNITAPHGHEVHSAEELRYLLEQSKESGEIKSSEHELIENVFYFSERTVRQVMVARTNIAAIDITMTTDEIVNTIIEEGYSRMPVYRDSLDNIVGVLYAKDLLTLVRHKELIVVQDILRPAYFIHETQQISVLLKEFQRRRIQMAVVTDEFGGTAGIVTVEDIMEELVGEIQDEYDEESPITEQVGEHEYVVNATAPVVDVNEFIPIPLPESEDYSTLGGLLNTVFGKIPDVNERTEFAGYEFVIMKKSKRNVELVRMRRLPSPPRSRNIKEES